MIMTHSVTNPDKAKIFSLKFVDIDNESRIMLIKFRKITSLMNLLGFKGNFP